MVTLYITSTISKADCQLVQHVGMVLCVPFPHVLIHVNTTTIKIQNYSITTKISLALLLLSHTHTPIPNPRTPLLFAMSIILLFQECCINAIIHNVTLWDWLFPVSQIPLRPIHVVACIDMHSVFIVASYSFLGMMSHSWFNQQPVELHLCGFQFGAITNKVPRTFPCKILCGH